MKIKRFFEKFRDSLSSRRIYFIYTHNNHSDRFRYGLKANTEISYWCLSALKRQFPRVSFLHLEGEKDSRIRKISSRDIVVGHIGDTYRKACERSKRIIAFYPWSGHPDRNQIGKFNCIPEETELKQLSAAQSIVFLTSEYNERKYIHKNSNHWFDFCTKNKIRIVHQPIDLQKFSRVKFSYKTSNFFYIGNNAHMKCLPHSETLLRTIGKKLTIYGTPETKRFNNLNTRAIQKLAKDSDFFIQAGMWEGQCVSILEAAARGFIPIVSPETGYPYKHPFLLRYNDLDYNLGILKKLIKTHEEERKDLANDLYKSLTKDNNHNNWDRLTNVLIEEIKNLL